MERCSGHPIFINHYQFEGDNKIFATDFLKASKNYGRVQPTEERFSIEWADDEDSTRVVLRKIASGHSFSEAEEEADAQRETIENIAIHNLGNTALRSVVHQVRGQTELTGSVLLLNCSPEQPDDALQLELFTIEKEY